MVPTEEQAKQLWDTYNLPEEKRRHVSLVAKVALFLSEQLIVHPPAGGEPLNIDKQLLLAGCLLHDVDKNVQRQPGERHPETAVRILKEEGMEEVAELIKNHSVHYIEYPDTAPKTWEEKLLFLADKMVKYEVVGVDERFKLWLEEELPEEEKAVLERVYPFVKQLEDEIFSTIGIESREVVQCL